MLTSRCSKFIQETMCQTSLQLPGFCRRYYRKHFGLFFPDTVYMPPTTFFISSAGVHLAKFTPIFASFQSKLPRKMFFRRPGGCTCTPSQGDRKFFSRHFWLKCGKNGAEFGEVHPRRWDKKGRWWQYMTHTTMEKKVMTKKGHQIFGQEKCTWLRFESTRINWRRPRGKILPFILDLQKCWSSIAE